jgi:hypothetical protein
MVHRKLNKNTALRRKLTADQSDDGVPIEGEQIERLSAFIARGLAWHHREVCLDDGKHSLRAVILTLTLWRFSIYGGLLLRGGEQLRRWPTVLRSSLLLAPAVIEDMNQKTILTINGRGIPQSLIRFRVAFASIA